MDTSIILPTHNGAHRIAQAIESVQKQTYTNWELIIIDDGSTDTTRDIVQQFSQNDARIVYYKNDHNLGIQKTLNRGLSLAQGEYIARIDDDDQWIDSTKLEQQISFLKTHTKYVLVGTGAIVADENGTELYRYMLPESDTKIRQQLLQKNCFVHSSIVFRKKIVADLGGYSESKKTRHVEDYDLWLRIGEQGMFKNLPIHGVLLTSRESSLTNNNRLGQAWKSLLLSYSFFSTYPRGVYGLFVSLARVLFFATISVLHIRVQSFYFLMKLYKK